MQFMNKYPVKLKKILNLPKVLILLLIILRNPTAFSCATLRFVLQAF